ncbi:hypothetical protein HDU83_003155 [Entophlyctis luteolus]|nr:hypothetical protein HDU83_003155 [Entophlyctis luteolus]
MSCRYAITFNGSPADASEAFAADFKVPYKITIANDWQTNFGCFNGNNCTCSDDASVTGNCEFQTNDENSATVFFDPATDSSWQSNADTVQTATSETYEKETVETSGLAELSSVATATITQSGDSGTLSQGDTSYITPTPTFSSVSRALYTATTPPASATNDISATATSSSQETQASFDPKIVIAHNMIIFPIYNVSIEGYKQEIIYAQKFKLDGFAINIQPPLATYLPNVDLIYEAALQLGISSFKLCLSFDLSYNYAVSDIASAIARYASHPNQLVVEGRVFVSTFSGQATTLGYSSARDAWVEGVIPSVLAQTGMGVYFVPNFWVDYTAEVYLGLDFIDGIFDWECWPSAGNQSDIVLQAASMAAQKTYMAAISPWFYKHNTYGNWYQGDYDIVERWMDLININPMMIEIVTWNDFSESTYIGSYAPNIFITSDGVHHSVDDHEAFGMLSSYFIQWYKLGYQPAINVDQIFFWFRPHSSSAVASNDPYGLPSWYDGPYVVPLVDRIYGVLFLVDDAVVIVQSGTQTSSFSLYKGVQKLPEVLFVQGFQSVTISRNGHAVKTVQAAVPVNNTIETYDFNAFAAYG